MRRCEAGDVCRGVRAPAVPDLLPEGQLRQQDGPQNAAMPAHNSHEASNGNTITVPSASGTLPRVVCRNNASIAGNAWCRTAVLKMMPTLHVHQHASRLVQQPAGAPVGPGARDNCCEAVQRQQRSRAAAQPLVLPPPVLRWPLRSCPLAAPEEAHLVFSASLCMVLLLLLQHVARGP